jgi:hypothetical protein
MIISPNCLAVIQYTVQISLEKCCVATIAKITIHMGMSRALLCTAQKI